MEIKCNVCGKKFNDEEIVYAPKKKNYYYFCDACYKQRKGVTDEMFNKYKEETRIHLKDKAYKQKIYTIFSKYKPVDKRLPIFLSQIFTGKFSTKKYQRGMKISPEEMLDMLVKMESYLDKKYQQINDLSSVTLYFLAIIYNSYPRYIRTIKKQKRTQQDIRKVDTVASVVEKATIKQENDVDLDDFLL